MKADKIHIICLSISLVAGSLILLYFQTTCPFDAKSFLHLTKYWSTSSQLDNNNNNNTLSNPLDPADDTFTFTNDYCQPFRVLYLVQGSNIESSPKWYNLLFNNYSQYTDDEMNNDMVYLIYKPENEHLLSTYNTNPQYKHLTMISGYNTTWTTGRNLLYEYALLNEYNLTLKSLGTPCKYKYFAYLDEDLVLISYARSRGDIDIMSMEDSSKVLKKWYSLLSEHEPSIGLPFVSLYLGSQKYKDYKANNRFLNENETAAIIGMATGFDPMALWIHAEYFRNKLLLPYSTKYDQTWQISGHLFDLYNQLLLPRNQYMIVYDKLYLYNGEHRKYDKAQFKPRDVRINTLLDMIKSNDSNVANMKEFEQCFNTKDKYQRSKFVDNGYRNEVIWINEQDLKIKRINYTNRTYFQQDTFALCPSLK